MIEFLDEARVSEVVALHLRVLGHTLNSQIGSWFLTKLYNRILLSNGNGFCYIYTQDSRILGFVSWCMDHALLESEIRKSITPREKWRIFSKIFTRPALWGWFIRQLLFSRYLNTSFPNPYTTILTLGVSPDAQGRGVGKSLIDAVKQEIDEQRTLYVDTEAHNISALVFYEKSSFQKVTTRYGNVILKYTS